MDSKGVVAPEAFYGFNAPLIPMAMFDDYCWNNNQILNIDFAISNYLESNWSEPFQWTLSSDKGEWKKNGELSVYVAQGEVANVGNISVELSQLTEPTRLTLNLATGN